MPRRRPSHRPTNKPMSKLISRIFPVSAARHGFGGGAPEGAVERAIHYAVEPLEQRTLFTTIGLDPFDHTTVVPDGILEFSQGRPKTIVRVAWHDVIAELIGVSVPGPNDAKAPTPADIPTPGEDLFPAADNAPEFAPNLFTIYIAHSKADSWISIAEVPALTSPTRDMDPFTGGPGLSINNAGTGKTPINFSPAVGGVLIGQKHTIPQVDANVPIFSAPPTPALGVFPGTNGAPLGAGVFMAPTDFLNGTPNDIGEILIGGTILGSVNIPSSPGTVALPASQGGNVGLFYAGTILTGDSTGVFQVSGVAAHDPTFNPVNFYVGGDLRDLVTLGSIGGDPIAAGRPDLPQYLTSFSGIVEGTLGEAYSLNGSILGSLDVHHNPVVPPAPSNLLNEFELEYRPNPGNNPIGPIFQGGLIIPASATVDPVTGLFQTLPPRLPPPFNNDSAAHPQYLGSIAQADPHSGLPIRDQAGNIIYEATVNGILQGSLPNTETADFYAVSLMAGQHITVTGSTTQLLQVQVIDPDGRIVASDNSNNQPLLTLDQPFSFTADRPGIYNFNVTNLTGVTDLFDIPYTLTLQGVGNMGMGALVAQTGEIFDGGIDRSVAVENGDLGTIFAGTNYLSDTFGPTTLTLGQPSITPTSLSVNNGDVRTISGGSLGFLGSEAFAPPTIIEQAIGIDIPYIDVPRGSIGLFGAINPAGILAVQTRFDLNNLSRTVPISAIGGDIQEVHGAGPVYLQVAANRGLGMIKALSMATSPASYIDVNADNIGFDGKIDLIDVTQNLGRLADGGPALVTHDGGDVRYMRVGLNVFEDAFFGGGFPVNTLYNLNETVNVTDDSGTKIQMIPSGTTRTIQVVDPNNPAALVTETLGPQIDTTTYGVRDHGGVVLIDVNCTGSLTINATGNNGAASVAEFSRVEVQGVGSQIDLATTGTLLSPKLDVNGEQTLTATAPAASATGVVPPPLTLDMNGPATIDVLQVVAVVLPTVVPVPPNGPINVGGTLANIDRLANNTAGEVTSVLAHSIGTFFSHGTIGLAKSSTPAAVDPMEPQVMTTGITNVPRSITATTGVDVTSLFPYQQQHIGILASWNVLSISADEGVGNLMVDGTFGSVTANADGHDVPGVFEGINGPIIAHSFVGLPIPPVGGRILQVNIGEGILPSGTGAMGSAGIYAFSDIGTVTNNGLPQADIRGDIVSNVGTIDNISLQNASIINADIMIVGTFDQSAETNFGFATTDKDAQDPITVPSFDIRQINVTGRGGIIGSLIVGSDIGPIDVGTKGFGILETTVLTSGQFVLGTVTAGGYGIRGDLFEGGAGAQGLSASGGGGNLSVASFYPDVRQSESVTEDPFFGTIPNKLTDLDAYLGTSAAAPVIAGVTDTGVIEDTIVRGTTFLTTVHAQTIRVSQPVFIPTPLPLTSVPNIPSPGQQFATEFDTANNIGSIVVRGTIDGLQVTTGTLGLFRHSGSISRCGISVAGAINSLTINGNFGQVITDPGTGNLIPDSYINAGGADGVIRSLRITGSLFGNVSATGNITRMTVGGNVVGNITANGRSKFAALGYLRVGGNLGNGSLTIHGSAGTIIASGGFGTTTGTLTVEGDLGSLSVGAQHHRAANNALSLALHVEGSLGKLNVFGRVDGTITIDHDLVSMKVINDGTTGNILNGNLTVGGRIYAASFSGGNVNANVTANGFIRSFSVARGNFLSGHTIQSQIDSIQNFKITGGLAFGMLGSLLAGNGQNENIDISGNFGDGVNAATIVALSGGKFRVRGSIFANTQITVRTSLNSLQVDGNINPGAVVSAHPLNRLKVGGSNLGTVTVV